MKTTDLTTGNIRKAMLRFALPFLASSLLQALYGATDLYVVGRFNGSSAISAVNIGSQVMQIITSFVIGCSMGSTVLIGTYIGKKENRSVARTIGNTISVFVLLAVILTPIMLLTTPSITTLMQTPDAAVAETRTYIFICSLGIPFIIMFNVCASILRGMGDSKTPMQIVAVACLSNIAGDFLLTGAFDLGVLGVAIATSCAQMLSSVYGCIVTRSRTAAYPFRKSDLKPEFTILKRILIVGIPIAAQDTLINISFMIITVIANNRGLTASSAVGIVEKIIMFMFLVPSALLSSISTITAQNIGAGKPERAKQALRFGIVCGVSFGCVMCAVSWICPQILTGIFTRDAAVMLEADEYIKTYSIDCILVGITFCLNGYLSGMSKSIVTFIHNVIAIFLVRIPMAYLTSRLFPDSLLPMGLASPLGSLASILILAIYFRIINRPAQSTD